MMIPPQKETRGVGSPRTSVPLRGLFADGVWRCNCRGRPPAAKHQTKNHGVNHGRWFYTCQQPQQNRCNFFLWTSDAEAREKMTVLNNSRSESGSGSGSFTQSQTQTPTKTPRQGSGLFTPQTNTNERRIPDIPPLKPNTPSSSAKAKMMSEDMEEFEWDEDLDDEVNQILERPSQRQQQPNFGQETTPRKTSLPRTPGFTTPGKRKLEDIEESEGTLTPPQSNKRSAASTSFSSFSFSGSQSQAQAQASQPPPASSPGLPSFASTPTRFSSSGTIFSPSSSADTPSLSRQVMSLLQSHKVVLPRAVQDELTALVDRHDLRTQGIVRGRDISRISLRKKDEQIMKLNERIASLESQRAMDRALIDGLRGYDGRS